MRVLIIEQSEDIITRLEQLITESVDGVAFTRAVSYPEALHHTSTAVFDIVLLDIRLAEIQSFELLALIKRAHAHTFIAILFHIQDEYSMHQCRANGVDHFFDKYTEFEKIPAVINQLGGRSAKK